MTWRGATDPSDRFLACLPYLLPLLNAYLAFSSPFFSSLPALRPLFLPLDFLAIPYILIVGFIPGGFGSFILFLALYLLIVRNGNIRHFIRYNTMQSIIFGIVLSIGSLLWQFILSGILGNGLIQQTIFTTLFLGTLAAVIYAIVQSLRGHYAEIPTISDAVRPHIL